MIATFFNVFTVVLGGLIGTLFGNRIGAKYTDAIMTAIGLITVMIGVQSLVGSSNTLLVVVCLILGTVIGTALKIDDNLNKSGDFVKAKLSKTRLGQGRFTEAFVTCSMLFAVGTMTVIGSIQAGLNQNYDILITKSIMDFVSAIAFSSALGAGVLFAAVTVLVVQGSITLLAGVIAPVLTAEVVTEMSAVGGALFIAMAINLLNLRKEKIKVGDMLPGIFLPIIYFPLQGWLSGLM